MTAPFSRRDVPPSYLQEEILDRLARMNLELLSELWITRDRVAVLEELLRRKGVLAADEVDLFAPDPDFAARLDAARALMVEQVMSASGRQLDTVDDLKAKGARMRAARAAKA